jgi:hypothetical protein
MNKTNINTSYDNDIRIVIPKEKIQENMKHESFFIKLLKKLNIL